MAQLVSRLKYTPIEVRSKEYEARPRQRSRALIARSQIEMIRASPGDMASKLQEDGLILDLKGVPCPRVKCQSSKTEGFLSSRRVLGKRCWSNCLGPDIATETVWHRCSVCRVKQSIGLHNPLYRGFCGPSSVGITKAFKYCGMDRAPRPVKFYLISMKGSSGI